MVRVGLYISKQNREVADLVLDLVESDDNLVLSDWIWGACRLRLAHQGQLPIMVAIRSAMEEVLAEHLGNGAQVIQPETKPAKNDGFFSGIMKDVS